jgi:hypothetical protein
MNVVAQLVITLDESGNVGINGPLENRLLCFGMMEMAKDGINKKHDADQKRIVQVAPGTTLRPVPPQS